MPMTKEMPILPPVRTTELHEERKLLFEHGKMEVIDDSDKHSLNWSAGSIY